MTGFIVKANKKLRSQEPSVSWSTDTWLDELRSSSDYTSRASMTENWWKATPALR
jgi:hypothetical protein